MDHRRHQGTDADVRAWLRGVSPDGARANVAAPPIGRVAEFVLEQPMGALEPMLAGASVLREPPPAGAPREAELDHANRAVAVAFARFRLGSPERPGWPGFGSRSAEQHAIVFWAEVTATRAPGFAQHLLGVIVSPESPDAVRHARIVVLAATGRVEEARREAIALAHDWLLGPRRSDLPAADLEQLLARLPPDEELAALRDRVLKARARRS